jgi:hypothetical protein
MHAQRTHGCARTPGEAPTSASAAQEGAYEATLARVRELLEQRGDRYAAADLHVSLAADAGGAPDAVAPAAVVAWRRAAPRAPGAGVPDMRSAPLLSGRRNGHSRGPALHQTLVQPPDAGAWPGKTLRAPRARAGCCTS